MIKKYASLCRLALLNNTFADKGLQENIIDDVL